MKRVKQFLSVILAMTMVLAMSMTAFASEITINDGKADGSTYSAYRLFDATVGKNADGETTISYTLNSKYSDALIEAVGGEADWSEQEILAEIANYGSTATRTFANSVYEEIKADSTLTPEYTTTTNKIENAAPGYYLLVETAVGTNGTYSLAMLNTAANDVVTVETKEDVPTLVKKVKETNDTEGTTTDWQDGADYEIGDNVPFQLTGTLPSTYDSYKTYYYSFHDVLSAGLTFNNDVIVKVDGTAITQGYKVVTELDDGCGFEVQFSNLKDITTVTKDSVITVEYTAKLNENAVIAGNGNTNKAKLEYSNNPYYDPSGKEPETTSETVEDQVVVFTYVFDVNKVDKDGNKLKGAGFTLYKLVMNESTGKASYQAVGSEIKGEDITIFEFKGLDAGTYKLEETTVPSGYNKAADIEFVVDASYDIDADEPEFGAITIKDTKGSTIVDEEGHEVFAVTAGVISTDVVNVSGILLPSTGGIGTAIFYIVGAVLMIGAVVLLVRNKRAAK